MKHLKLLPLALIALVPALGAAQVLPQSTAAASEIQKKVRKVDLLNQILPVLLTPDQIKKLLPVIEKARQEEAKLTREEESILRGLDADLDKAIEEGLEKRLVPSVELINRVFKTYRAIATARSVLVEQQGQLLLDKAKEVLNEGQIKAARNAIDPRVYAPDIDPETVSDEEKLRYWVTGILLDPMAYDLLVTLSEKK